MENREQEPREKKQAGLPAVKIDFLGLPDCVTLRKDRMEHILLVRASYEPQKAPPDCPVCHKSCFRIAPDAEILYFWDIPRGTRPVLVQLFVHPFTCSCGRPQDIKIPRLHLRRNMTYRLEKHIEERAATLSTFAQIALDTCQSENTVRVIFSKAFRKFDEQLGKDLPRVLQIDEVYFHRRRYTILVDGETGAAVDLLNGHQASVIEQRLKEAGNLEAVEYWCQDY